MPPRVSASVLLRRGAIRNTLAVMGAARASIAPRRLAECQQRFGVMDNAVSRCASRTYGPGRQHGQGVGKQLSVEFRTVEQVTQCNLAPMARMHASREELCGAAPALRDGPVPERHLASWDSLKTHSWGTVRLSRF
jgi:hypothetical protein